MANYNDYVKIESSILPNIYPDDSYIDRFYTLNRVVRDGYYDEMLITSEKFKTVQDNFSNQRNIQSLIYNKYYIKIFTKESTNLGLLKFADYIKITCQNNEVHQAKIISIEKTDAGTTKGQIYTISYADINPDNYTDGTQSVSDFLKSDTLLARFGALAVNKLTFTNNNLSDLTWITLGKTFSIYTVLSPRKSNAELQELNQKLNGLEIASRQISQLTLDFRFYISEIEALRVNTYMALCTDNQIVCRSPGYTGTYVAEERIIPKTSQLEGVDLWQLDVTLKYKNIVYNNYE